VLFEHHNQVGRRYGLFDEDSDDEDSDDEDLEEPEPEPEMVRGHPCPMCGRRNEKVSSSIFSPCI
jgi:E3 ubiquitin-protein ligase RNF14